MRSSAASDVYKRQPYAAEGINVNFVKWDDEIHSRTFERGVEGETFSCGTGAVAIALTSAIKGYTSPVHIHTLGGLLQVSWQQTEQGAFTNVVLSGPTKRVFEGTYSA